MRGIRFRCMFCGREHDTVEECNVHEESHKNHFGRGIATEGNLKTIIVAGLGRCGSSLVMQMLAASGFEVTGEYPAFEDERVNLPSTANLWSGEWRGKAVKVLDPHRCDLHLVAGDLVIWIDRNVKQQALSTSKFGHLLAGLPLYRGRQLKQLEAGLERDRKVCLSMFRKSGRQMLVLNFEPLVTNPVFMSKMLANFVGGNADAMASVVRPRGPKCYPGLLELELLQGAA